MCAENMPNSDQMNCVALSTKDVNAIFIRQVHLKVKTIKRIKSQKKLKKVISYKTSYNTPCLSKVGIMNIHCV